MKARDITLILTAGALGVAVGAGVSWCYTVWRLDQLEGLDRPPHAAGVEHQEEAEPGVAGVPDAEIPPQRAPTALVSAARIRPAFAGGQRSGLRVTSLRDGFLAEIGVEEGDVLTRINGIGLDSKRGALDLLDELAYADAIALRVRRADGGEAELFYP